MVAQAGRVVIPVDVQFQGQALRVVALDKAIQLHSGSEVNSFSAKHLVEAAKEIETYINGPEPMKDATPEGTYSVPDDDIEDRMYFGDPDDI